MQAVRRCAQVTLALSALLAQHPAEAACNRPDIQFAVPPDGADGVPPNAKLFARYRSNAEYTGEEINLQQVGGSTQQLTGEWSSAETLLGVVPSLEPGESYSIDWPRLRGVNSASLGKGKTVAFDVDGHNYGNRYGGKDFDRLSVVAELRAALPTVRHVVLHTNLAQDPAEVDRALASMRGQVGRWRRFRGAFSLRSFGRPRRPAWAAGPVQRLLRKGRA